MILYILCIEYVIFIHVCSLSHRSSTCIIYDNLSDSLHSYCSPKKNEEIFYSLTYTHTHVHKIIVYFIKLNNLIWRILLEKLTNENYSILKCLFEIFMGIIESLTFSRSRTFIEPNHWLYSHLIIITNQFKQTSIEQNSES